VPGRSSFWLLRSVLLCGDHRQVKFTLDNERPCSFAGFTACRSRYKRKKIFHPASVSLDALLSFGTNVKRRASAVFQTLEAASLEMVISDYCCSSAEHAGVVVNSHFMHSIACRRSRPVENQKGKNATPAQISLAWLLAQKPFMVPIPGTPNINHLDENLGAMGVQLTPVDLREIDAALSEITVHGGRMNEEQMRVVDQTV
jgi:hypothetical protein